MDQSDITSDGNPNSRRILLVDDEEMLAQATRRLLERSGHRVTLRTDPLKALAEFQADPFAFDLVITDQNMPGLNGAQLAELIRSVRPDIAIFLVTGDGPPGEENGANHCEILQKPFSPPDLLAAIARQVRAQA